MQPIPTEDLRNNIATFAVPTCMLPAVAHFMHDALPNEEYDPHFYGQALITTYFDTADFDLRKARSKGGPYITIRVRQYPGGALALSAKTDQEKFRLEIIAADIDSMIASLPANLQVRLMDIAGAKPIVPVISVYARRYAIEDDQDRFTLDVDVCTELGRSLPYGVLEFKSNTFQDPPPTLQAINLKPIKISKFLWATVR